MEGGGVEVENGVKQACWRENGGEGNVSGVEPILPMEFANDIYIYISHLTIFVSTTFVSSQFLFYDTNPFLHYIFPTSTETLFSWDFPDAVGRSTNPQSQCLCQTSNCLCCIDLNLTATFDLGGPACINVRQKEQNVSLNLSYGDNPVHNATIKIGETDFVRFPTLLVQSSLD